MGTIAGSLRLSRFYNLSDVPSLSHRPVLVRATSSGNFILARLVKSSETSFSKKSLQKGTPLLRALESQADGLVRVLGRNFSQHWVRLGTPRLCGNYKGILKWVVVKIMVPFWGTLNIRCRIIIGIPQGTIILTTTQVHLRDLKRLTLAKSPISALKKKGLGFRGAGRLYQGENGGPPKKPCIIYLQQETL